MQKACRELGSITEMMQSEVTMYKAEIMAAELRHRESLAAAASELDEVAEARQLLEAHQASMAGSHEEQAGSCSLRAQHATNPPHHANKAAYKALPYLPKSQ